MKGKKAFTAYCDWIETFEALDDEQAGKLVKHLFRYVNDQNPEPENPLVKAVFASMKATLKRDLQKWLGRLETNRENGLKGGRPPKPKETQKNPIGLSKTQANPKKGDRDRDRVRDSDKDIDKEIDKEKLFAKQVRSLKSDLPKIEIDKFISYWTEKSPRGIKLRFEKQKTFDPQRRLETWERNYLSWQKEKSSAKKEKPLSDLEKLQMANQARREGVISFSDE